MAARSDKRCGGTMPSALDAKSAYAAPYQPISAKKLSRRLAEGTAGHYNRPMVNRPTNERDEAPGDEVPGDEVPGFGVSEERTTSVAKHDNTTSVILRGVRVPLDSNVGWAFVTDLARNKERLFSDQQVCEKYDITPDDWTEIRQSKAIRLAVNAEHERRMLNGTAAQESAAKIFTEAPEVLGSILRDNKASPRHRIEASKELRATARAGDEKTGPDTDRVIIRINLGADVKPLVIDSGPLPPKQPKEATDGETDQW
jgi:hypothetical protein